MEYVVIPQSFSINDISISCLAEVQEKFLWYEQMQQMTRRAPAFDTPLIGGHGELPEQGLLQQHVQCVDDTATAFTQHNNNNNDDPDPLPEHDGQERDERVLAEEGYREF